MRSLLSPLLIGLTLIAVVSGCGSTQPQKPGDYNFTLMVGEVQRHALLHIPPGYDGVEPLPLVMMLHGGGGSSRAVSFETGWSAKADAENFFVLYPDALARDPAQPSSFSGNPQLWNDGSERFDESTGQVDDVAFLASLLIEVSKRMAVDSTRVYLAGHSNGASMAFRFTAERADLVTALAPVAGACWLEEIKLARPVPLCYITGLLDPLNPMEGGVPTLANGLFEVGRGKAKPPVKENLRRWTRALGCPDDPTSIESEQGYTVTTYGPAENGAEARLVTIEAQGHNWPGGRGLLPESMAGPNSTNLNATDYIWSFFQRPGGPGPTGEPVLPPDAAPLAQ